MPSPSSLHAANTHRPLASRPTPQPASHDIPCDSAGRVGVSVQPAAELRHVQRHRHEQHVYCALRASPAPSTHPGPRLHAACTAAPPHALTPPGQHAARTMCPPYDSAESEGVQRATELRHVQRHRYETNVLCALRASPAPRYPSRPSPARFRPKPSRLPACMPPASNALLLLVRRQSPCPTQTSCSCVALGRGTRGSAVLLTVRIGGPWANARHCLRVRRRPRRHRPRRRFRRRPPLRQRTP